MADRQITEDMVEAALLGAMGYDAVHDDDETPKGDDYFRGQMRAALEAATGVTAGSTASAGAPVSPVQTTDHAGATVAELPDEQQWTVHHVQPDDVLLIGNVRGAMRDMEEIVDRVQGLYPERRIIFFSDDIDVKLLREVEADRLGAGSVSPKGDNTDGQ